jgi:hypothetical protein
MGTRVNKVALSLRVKTLNHGEQASSPALEKNSRGRLFHILSFMGVVQNGHESLAGAMSPLRNRNAG